MDPQDIESRLSGVEARLKRIEGYFPQAAPAQRQPQPAAAKPAASREQA